MFLWSPNPFKTQLHKKAIWNGTTQALQLKWMAFSISRKIELVKYFFSVIYSLARFHNNLKMVVHHYNYDEIFFWGFLFRLLISLYFIEKNFWTVLTQNDIVLKSYFNLWKQEKSFFLGNKTFDQHFGANLKNKFFAKFCSKFLDF